MENFQDGCILLSRSLMESSVFQNEKWLKVWIWCLLKANHKKMQVPIVTGKGSTVVEIDRGQFIFGRHKAAKELKMPGSTIRNIMDKLEKLQNLDTQKDTHYTIVTIRNYCKYQTIENYKGKKKDNQRTGKGQPKDTNKNVKNEKNIKTFAHFWSEYPKKKSKGQAEKIWNRLSLTEELFNQIMLGLETAKQSEDWQKEGGKFIPYPAKWLNVKGWEDEYKTREERIFA